MSDRQTTSKVITNWLTSINKGIPFLANIWGCSEAIVQKKLNNNIFSSDEIEKVKKEGCPII